MKKLLLTLLINSSIIFGANLSNVIGFEIPKGVSRAYINYLYKVKIEKENNSNFDQPYISYSQWEENGKRLMGLIFSDNPANYKEIEELVETGAADVNTLYKDNDTPLLIACRYDYMKIALLLLENGANPNLKNNSGFTALRCAFTNLNKSLIASLLEYNADPNDPILLSLVCHQADKDIIKLFVNKKANFDILNADGKPVSQFASKKVRSLIKKNRCTIQ